MTLRLLGHRLLRTGHVMKSLLLCTIALTAATAFSAQSEAAPAHFSLTSPTIRSGSMVPSENVGQRDECHGGNKSPALAWSHAPDGTASYAISMADLDAKVGVVWLWLMFNLPTSTASLPANAAADATLMPSGTGQSRNGFDAIGYSGPCPKKGAVPHHYLITVWALNAGHLTFKDGTPAETVAIFLRRHALGHASLTPYYSAR
ncbi:YbhB/YbcL family Raf kinase inhibitor-like protein [Acidisoma cellulosilytica]|uniref:YbhB/YbcL family Raf kinase inhibitor-like protein n=1 Tax=Acidisoma cellulosilyticum TaxID=2802395 RepID=A0A963YXY2_9PROT|nr:YbhB/YbcL family Raf kinase inhibitor-like protein [Acidisoma cellulosilyticum]MCB8879184.1 YbhB/YbcL family Raf kinase inhibitor-like protein [Acidisoma cellulosilyticum]